MDISKVTDPKELKAMKSDNYDLIEQAKRQIEASTQNINMLSARIVEIEKEKSAKEPDVAGLDKASK